MKRRDFIRTATVARGTPLLTGGLAASAADQPPRSLPRVDSKQIVTRVEMRYRKLGKTGVEVSCIGVGGYHIGLQKEESETIKIIRSAIDAGITFMDNCWDYREGKSEQQMG